MTKTLRQYAEDIKQASGTALGIFEMAQNVPAGTDQKTWITNFINALPNSVLSQIAIFPDTGEIAGFVMAVGPVLEVVAPIAA